MNDPAAFVPIQRIRERVARAREESDTAYFYDLMIFGEFVLKLIAAGMIAAVEDEKDGLRYRLEATLVRSDGLGDWPDALNEVLTGPASQHLVEPARPLLRQFTEAAAMGAWQSEALMHLDQACRVFDGHLPALGKAQLRHWAPRFVWLRNRTRGHGAPSADRCQAAAGELAQSLQHVVDNLSLLQLSWAFLHRSLSGKYRVVPFGGDASGFDDLKRRNDVSVPDGAYLRIGSRPVEVRLLHTDLDLSDFYMPNGAFAADRYQVISYITDEVEYVDTGRFVRPPTDLPPSETQGLPELDVVGSTLATLPARPMGYVSRPALENNLRKLLADDRWPIVSLSGRGGIGKTSLALQVLHETAKTQRYDAIVWFSARDIDLLPQGPKAVRPAVLALPEIAAEFARLVVPSVVKEKGFDAIGHLGEVLAGDGRLGPVLLVFDNFETIAAPDDLYRWLSDCIRVPNKVLITTRVRNFPGDYPVEVGGMTSSEFETLVFVVARQLLIEGMVTPLYVSRLYDESDGHPYVAKILLGEAARTGRAGNVQRIMADRDDILAALFERTYANALTPAAQRVFLTLCGWKTAIPEIALKAALLRPANERMNVDAAVEELIRSSMVEAIVAPDGQRFLTAPLAAVLFGQKKLAVSQLKTAVENDVLVIRDFGSPNGTDVSRGVMPRIESLVRAVATRVQNGSLQLADAQPMLEFVADGFPAAWLMVSQLYEDNGQLKGAIEAVERYLQSAPADIVGWRRMTQLYRRSGDWLGEMHSLLELSALPQTPMGEISEAVSRFNYHLANDHLDLEVGEKRVIAEKLRKIMESHLSAANATDLSRLGWVCVHLKDPEAARRYAQRGLELEPTNQHCQKLVNLRD